MRSQTQIDLLSMCKESLQNKLLDLLVDDEELRAGDTEDGKSCWVHPRDVTSDPNWKAIGDAECMNDALHLCWRVIRELGPGHHDNWNVMMHMTYALAFVVDEWSVWTPAEEVNHEC
jgi:hypothetical protein